MDGNIYQNSPNSGYPPYAPDLFNGGSNEIMPPVAPSYRHSPWPAERSAYPAYDSEQQALNRLMDTVHKSRIEDVHIGKDTAEFYLEDARVVGGEIEIHARIIPKPGINQFHPQYPYQYHSQVPLQYSNQYPYQYPYQYLNQLPPAPQYPYQYLNQLPIQYPYQYLNQLPIQYPYLYRYPNQFPARYLYQHPVASAAGSIAGAISELVLTANLLRRY